MKIAFLGDTHAALHLSKAAADKGFELVELEAADLAFVSMDTPTDAKGNRDLQPIRKLIEKARAQPAPIVLTSAVPPGFTRSLGFELWHQAETLRISDAAERAAHPEMMIVGCRDSNAGLPMPYATYLAAFGCPVIRMTWEEAELAKVAINCFLAAQVDATNLLSAAAGKVGARWPVVAEALRHDARIGPKAYLRPGRWEDSPHLMRDFVTLKELGRVARPL